MAEQKLIKLKINEREVQVPQGTLVIEATRPHRDGSAIVLLLSRLSLQAACRMCLVEVEKAPKLQTACTLVAMEGMIVRTDTEQVRQARKYMLEFLLTNHPLDWPGMRQGRRVRIAGHGVPLRRGFEPLRRRKDSPAGREMVGTGLLRCAALHPVLPLACACAMRHGREGAGRGGCAAQTA